MDRILKIFNRIGSIASSILVFIMMVLIVIDVTLRIFGYRPVPGTIEFVRVFMASVVFLSVSYAEEFGSHIRAEIIISRISDKHRSWADMLAWSIGLLLFVLILWGGWEQLVESLESREYYPGEICVPVYPARALLVIGVFFFCVHFALNIIRKIIK